MYVILYSSVSMHVILYPSVNIYVILYPSVNMYVILYPSVNMYVILYSLVSMHVILYPSVNMYVILYPSVNMSVNPFIIIIIIIVVVAIMFESARAESRTLLDESFPHGRSDLGLATCVPLQCLYVGQAWYSSCCCALCWFPKDQRVCSHLGMSHTMNCKRSQASFS